MILLDFKSCDNRGSWRGFDFLLHTLYKRSPAHSADEVTMKNSSLTLDDLESLFPKELSPARRAAAKTLFLKELSLSLHRFYRGKLTVLPKVPLYGFNWFSLWYTPGVSAVSTSIRDDNALSYELSGRGNLVAVVSDSTRVLGDGDCTPPGGLGVMEGKVFLMKYLGGVDGVPLCINSRNALGEPDADKIIDFVRMAAPSFGAVNLEDISQPNCYRVLEVLRKECPIPVWHDDAQGTGSVTVAALINALRLAEKKISDVSLVFFGAGAANTSIARLIIQAGGNPERMILFDAFGSLHKGREEFRKDPRLESVWELCKRTNPKGISTPEEAFKNADALIALSKPGPGTIRGEWIRLMAPRSIVFACANPVPEIYPHEAKEAGAFIVATGRGDFPNQVNNSLGFPGILKGTLLSGASKITDSMALAASQALADFALLKGLTPERILPTMDETELYAEEAVAVAEQARRDGVATRIITAAEVRRETLEDIQRARLSWKSLLSSGIIPSPDPSLIKEALAKALSSLPPERE